MSGCGLEFRVTRHGAGSAERGRRSVLQAPGGRQAAPQAGPTPEGLGAVPGHRRPVLPWGESVSLWLVSESHRTSQASTLESVRHRQSWRSARGAWGWAPRSCATPITEPPLGGWAEAGGRQREGARGLGWAGEVGRGLRVPALGPWVRGRPHVSEHCTLLLGLPSPPLPCLAPHLPSPQDPSAAPALSDHVQPSPSRLS